MIYYPWFAKSYFPKYGNIFNQMLSLCLSVDNFNVFLFITFLSDAPWNLDYDHMAMSLDITLDRRSIINIFTRLSLKNKIIDWFTDTAIAGLYHALVYTVQKVKIGLS